VTQPAKDRGLIAEAAHEYMADRALRSGAGLAYYGVVTLGPMLVLLVGIAGLFVGEEARNGQLAESVSKWVGQETAQALADAINNLDVAGSFANLTIFSLVALVFAASVLFVAWKDTLNEIWGVDYRGGVKQTVRRRLFGFAVVGGLAVLFVALILVESVLAMLSGAMSDEPVIDTALRVAASVVPIALGTLLLSAMYRYGPDVDVGWRHIWPGTLLAVVSLMVMFWVYGWYVDSYGSSSVAGVASSALLLIVLVYFVAQILMAAAEFIKVKERRANAAATKGTDR